MRRLRRSSPLTVLTALLLAPRLDRVQRQRSSVGTRPSGARSTAQGAFPATVDTTFGAVTVPAKPQRVVALGWGDAETALALGVQPVGASDWLGFGGSGVGPWAQSLYTTAPTIIGTLEPSYEAIAALNPDLILDVKSSGDQTRHDKLTAIAPTVGIPTGADSFLTSLQQQTTMIGTALGVPDQAKALLSQIAAVRDGHAVILLCAGQVVPLFAEAVASR